jgi:hypothetical protein
MRATPPLGTGCMHAAGAFASGLAARFALAT